MRLSTRTTSIIAALLVSSAMVAGAFWLSGPGARSARALSTEEILRAYAAKDTDADGLPDWQEALYGTDPENPRSVDAGKTDAQAVAEGLVKARFSSETAIVNPDTNVPGIDAAPETLTDRFGRTFLENYLTLNQAGSLSEADMAAFIDSAASELEKERPLKYALSDIKLDARGQESLARYVEEMGATLARYSAAPDVKNVYEHFADFVTGAETERSMARIAELAEAYSTSATAIMELAVPPEVAGQHLDFANAYAALGEVVADMAAMKKDPLRGLLGLIAYADTWNRYSDALAALGKVMSEQLDY
jgi:hypothetical protein